MDPGKPITRSDPAFRKLSLRRDNEGFTLSERNLFRVSCYLTIIECGIVIYIVLIVAEHEGRRLAGDGIDQPSRWGRYIKFSGSLSLSDRRRNGKAQDGEASGELLFKYNRRWNCY